jgi:DNA-binding GntR family transcriptional regulator
MTTDPRLHRPDVKIGRSVAEALRAKILSGDLAPGQRLIEADLMAELDVGRSAIREAFLQLDADGLVELRHQKGAAVTKLSRQEMSQLFDIRERLEGFAAFLAAQRIDVTGNRAWLKAQRENWMRAEMLQNERTHMEENSPFHDGIIAMGGNDRLVEVLHRLQVPAYRQRFLKVLDEDRRQESVEDHVMVIDAILAGDAHKAEELMRLHVRRTGELALKIEGLS